MAFAYTPGFEHMKNQDYLRKPWRLLIYEYGMKSVEQARASGMTLAEAREYCESNRQERQCKMNRLLCGPKLVSKSSFFRLLPRRDGFKTATEHGVRRKIQFSI